MRIFCQLGFHGFVETREYNKPANSPETWIGNAGTLVIKAYICRRRNCVAVRHILTDRWTDIMVCVGCNKETRHEHRMLSDGGWDTWMGQGDKIGDFFRCLECGEIGKLLYGTRGVRKRVEIEWPQIPASILAANS